MADFNADAKRRIARTVQRKENGITPGNPRLTPRMPKGAYELKVTEIVEAMKSDDEPGTGKAKMRKFNGTKFSDGTDTYKIYNKTEKRINIGASVTCVMAYGRLFVVAVDKCSNLL